MPSSTDTHRYPSVTLLSLYSFLLHSGRCVFCERSDESSSPSLLLPLFQPSLPLPLSFLSWDCISVMLKHSSQGGITSLHCCWAEIGVCVHVCYTRGPARAARMCECVRSSPSQSCVSIPLTPLQYFQSIRGEFCWAGGLELICPDDWNTNQPLLHPPLSPHVPPVSLHLSPSLSAGYIIHPTVQLRYLYCVRVWERKRMSEFSSGPVTFVCLAWHTIEPWAMSLFYLSQAFTHMHMTSGGASPCV